MKKLTIFLVLAALAVAGGCSKQTQPQDANSTATVAQSAAPAGPLACVKDVPESAICTMDINSCGHSGSCNCGAGYQYNAAMGKCALDLSTAQGKATMTPVIDNDCIKPAKGACTKDLNACGQPSHCDCDEGYEWNPAAGKCVRSFG